MGCPDAFTTLRAKPLAQKKLIPFPLDGAKKKASSIYLFQPSNRTRRRVSSQSRNYIHLPFKELKSGRSNYFPTHSYHEQTAIHSNHTNMSHEQYQEGSSTTPAGLRTPSRLSKRPRYTLDGAEPPFDTLLSPVANEHQDETNAEDDEHEDDEPRHDQREQCAGEKRGPSTEAGSYSSPAIQKELADVRRLVKAFDAIDRSLSETREKLKVIWIAS